ncbi:replication initiation protein [Salmonella enterica]
MGNSTSLNTIYPLVGKYDCHNDGGMPGCGTVNQIPYEMKNAKSRTKLRSVSQSNELTEAAYYLPLQAKRVLWLCLIQCFNDGEETIDDTVFKVTVADYQRIFNVGTNAASADIKKGLDMLLHSAVTFYPKDGEYIEIGIPWLGMAGTKRGRGVWQIEFNHRIMPYLRGLTSRFTSYSLTDCGKLNSVRTIRLYESLCQFRSTGVWITSHQWLSERFVLPESQRCNQAEMKRTFLNPALKQINEKTPIRASFTEDGEGNLVFTIVDTSPPKAAALPA